MAYMRGEIYIWDDESGLHLWNAEGYDGWHDTVWATWTEDVDYSKFADDETPPLAPSHVNASGVSIPMDVMDEYVMMRLAQIIIEGKAEETVRRAIAVNGNNGQMALENNVEKIIAGLNAMQLEGPSRMSDVKRNEPTDTV